MAVPLGTTTRSMALAMSSALWKRAVRSPIMCILERAARMREVTWGGGEERIEEERIKEGEE
jgi:hypothetical protein